MSKKTIVSLVVVAVLIVGVSLILGNKNTKPGEEESTTPVSKKMAFSEFLKQGGTYKCEINQKVDNTETKGTTYINGEMIRGEYSTKVENVDINSTILVRDGYTYSWTSSLPNMGFKIKMDPKTTDNSGINNPSSYGFNAEQIGDYNCEAWTLDQSKFTVPTNITFRELETK